MKTLLKNGNVINVFTDEIIKTNVLIDGDLITGVGDYTDEEADTVVDLEGKYVCPGFIDGHIHIESTMLTPAEFAKVALKHGTTSVVTDPHEIANVSGTVGIHYMLRSTEGLPVTFYIMLPSCVPATGFDDSWEAIGADKLSGFYENPRVLGLAEMMNYPGVVFDDPSVYNKLAMAKNHHARIDGHAPLLSGKQLDKYTAAGITSDHECTSIGEAMEKLNKGQWIMIREGTAAKNLESLVDLFDGITSSRCLLATDDKEPSDLLRDGHIDAIIRKAVKLGKSPVTGIRLASLNAATYFGLHNVGAIAPGYKADINILDDLDDVSVCAVYKDGCQIVDNGTVLPFELPQLSRELMLAITDSMRTRDIKPGCFHVEPEEGKEVRVIEIVPGQIITNELHEKLDFTVNNGIDTGRDILKIAVVERHRCTGWIGTGYIKGIGLKKGAIASTVAHDSHNIIVIGTSDEEMFAAVNRIVEIGGGNVVVENGEVIDELPLEYGGLMSSLDVETLAARCHEVRETVYSMGVPADVAPFMNMAFVSLPVIPSLKLTCRGLVDVDKFELVPLFVEE